MRNWVLCEDNPYPGNQGNLNQKTNSWRVELRQNSKLIEIFAGQFSVRMNSGKCYSADDIVAALGVFGG